MDLQHQIDACGQLTTFVLRQTVHFIHGVLTQRTFLKGGHRNDDHSRGDDAQHAQPNDLCSEPHGTIPRDSLVTLDTGASNQRFGHNDEAHTTPLSLARDSSAGAVWTSRIRQCMDSVSVLFQRHRNLGRDSANSKMPGKCWGGQKKGGNGSDGSLGKP